MSNNPSSKSNTAQGKSLGYFPVTKKISYSLLCALPLLIGYESLIRVSQMDTNQKVVIGPANWVQQGMALLGTWGTLILAVLLLGFCIWAIYRDKKQGIKIKKGFLLLMLLESTAYAFVLAPVILLLLPGHHLIGGWLNEKGKDLALCLGAGFYEEFFFRLLFVGFPFALLDAMYPEKKPKLLKVIIFIAAAAAFSGIHYVGSMADTFTLNSFLFRFGAGLALGFIFLWRGFGVAAWTHAIYDIIVVFGILKLVFH